MHGLCCVNLNWPVVQQRRQQHQQASCFSANIECKQVDIICTQRRHDPECCCFSRYGKIVSTKAILDKTTNKCKGEATREPY